MPIDPVFHPMPTGNIAPTALMAPKKSNDLDRDTFLKLMIAQLKNQDPSSPVDSADFLAQTAQFSVVEKLEQMAKLNTELLAATRLGSASSLVGSSVTYLVPGADVDAAPVETRGIVSGVRVTADGLTLKVGKAEIALSAVVGVDPAPALTTTGVSATASTAGQ